ncbi:MurR/RpiR family transcriptional regulator [Ensifer soli]|uniref:MurR/RpiR family transcriptional regulator n=1 Tax=Ciceribacter sp. sgz301302 TaxID=3342379 RepID=UPI0035BA8E79
MTNERWRAAGSGGGDLAGRIAARYATLRRSEKVVADFLRDRAGGRLDSSITELGRTLGVSEATISRVSRALGYDGYPDMKLSLAGERRPAAAADGIDADASLVDTGAALAGLLVDGIDDTRRRADTELLETAVARLAAARRIVFMGIGGAAAIADAAAHMFVKAGFDASACCDGYTQTIVAATLGEGDVAIGLSHEGAPGSVAEALALAGISGAATIALTGRAGSAIAQSAAIVLATAGTGGGLAEGAALSGRIGQLFLVDLLYVGALFRKGAATAAALQATGAALTRQP